MTELRQKVERLEAALCCVEQVDCPVRHFRGPGKYAREITIPAGTVITGAIHKFENKAVLSVGRLLLATEDGPVEIVAPHILTVKPGQKNAATALEDSVWTNHFSKETTNVDFDAETDVDKLVELLTESRASDLIGGATNKQLAANKPAEQLEK